MSEYSGFASQLLELNLIGEAVNSLIASITRKYLKHGCMQFFGIV